MKQHYIIECFGLPGSGKSTSVLYIKNHEQLPESVRVLLRKEGDTKFLDTAFKHTHKKTHSLKQFCIITYYLIRRPLLFFYVLKSLLLLKFNRSYFSVLRTLIEALYCYSKIKNTKNKDTILFIDEGLIQYLGTLAVNVPKSYKIPKYIFHHVISNYISAMVYFDVDFKLAIERIKKRNDGRSRFDYMKNEEAIVNMNRMQNIFHLCIKIAQKLNIPILHVDNKKPSVENTEAILRFLNEMIK